MPRERRKRETDKDKDREVDTVSETVANRLTFSVSNLRDERCRFFVFFLCRLYVSFWKSRRIVLSLIGQIIGHNYCSNIFCKFVEKNVLVIFYHFINTGIT